MKILNVLKHARLNVQFPLLNHLYSIYFIVLKRSQNATVINYRFNSPSSCLMLYGFESLTALNCLILLVEPSSAFILFENFLESLAFQRFLIQKHCDLSLFEFSYELFLIVDQEIKNALGAIVGLFNIVLRLLALIFECFSF